MSYQRLRREERRGQLRLSLTNTYHEWPVLIRLTGPICARALQVEAYKLFSAARASGLADYAELGITGQSLRIFRRSDAAELVEHVAEAASDTSEESAIGVVWQRAAKHLQNELGGIDGK